jgi:hypothetical protein
MTDEQPERQDSPDEEQSDAGGEDRSGGDGEQRSEKQKAEESKQEAEKAKEEIHQLEEEGPPEKLEDWPSGMAKYETYGGPEGEHSYAEGPERKMGSADVRHYEGGEVEVEGENVDDPDEYKAEPIPGGPTDPNSPDAPGERDLSDEGGSDEGGSDEGGSSESKGGRSES